MSILAIDPSGNFHEGKGITGFCKYDGKFFFSFHIKSEPYSSDMKYYSQVVGAILTERPDHVVVEGYRLYNHRGMSAKTQSNSILETPQLIGIIRWVCFEEEIPLTVQYAVQVKNRWSDEVLVKSGDLIKKGNRFYLPNGCLITNHERDAYRHLLHYLKYGSEK